MKHLSFIRVAALLALVVTVASCGMPLYSTDGYYEEAPSRRDVYRGSVYGGSAPIVYERDPYTGRYYEVNPYSVYSRPGRYYDRRSNSRYYNNDRYNNNNRYNNSYGNNTYRNYPQQVQPQNNQQTPEQARKEREDAREKILGSKKSQ
jgi:hypothetical protein